MYIALKYANYHKTDNRCSKSNQELFRKIGHILFDLLPRVVLLCLLIEETSMRRSCAVFDFMKSSMQQLLRFARVCFCISMQLVVVRVLSLSTSLH